MKPIKLKLKKIKDIIAPSVVKKHKIDLKQVYTGKLTCKNCKQEFTCQCLKGMPVESVLWRNLALCPKCGCSLWEWWI